MIKAIVFDLDGMVYLTTEMFSDRYAREFNVDPEILVPFFKNQLVSCQNGEMDLKNELTKVMMSWNWQGTVEELFAYWFDDGSVNEQMMDLIYKLKDKGVLCVLCTNNEKYRLEYLKEKFNLEEVFDFIVTSYEVGQRKPEKEMYESILDKIKLKAEEVMICDDKEKHVEMLASWGFIPHVYKNYEGFKDKLNDLGLLK